MTPGEQAIADRQRAISDRILRRGKGINARLLRMRDAAASAALTPTEAYLADFRDDVRQRVRTRQLGRGVNKALLGEIEFSLDEPAKWGAACRLAVFRNWRNRR